jgi:hypothetical protein
MSPLLLRAVKATSRHCAVHNSVEEKAIAEARQRLLPLFIDIQSWNEPSAKNVKRDRQHAAALLKYTLDKDAGPIAETAYRNAAEVIKRKSPGRRGRGHEFNAARDKTITETVKALQEQGLSQERACEIVARLLEDIWKERVRYFKYLGKEHGADSVWIEGCQKLIDTLRLSEKRIRDIVKDD